MERSPQGNEKNEPERPRLDIDLAGPDGNVFNVIGKARAVLEGDARKEFNQVIWEAAQRGSGKTYMDILGIVNSYMDLTDISGTYEMYAPNPPDEQASNRGAAP